jgi:hypothetical protein
MVGTTSTWAFTQFSELAIYRVAPSVTQTGGCQGSCRVYNTKFEECRPFCFFPDRQMTKRREEQKRVRPTHLTFSSRFVNCVILTPDPRFRTRAAAQAGRWALLPGCPKHNNLPMAGQDNLALTTLNNLLMIRQNNLVVIEV